MRGSILLAAVLAVASTAVLAQSAAQPAAPSSPTVAPAQVQSENKDATAADKKKTAKNAVRALNGHRVHGPARISAAAKDTNGVAVVPKKKAPDSAAAPAASQ